MKALLFYGPDEYELKDVPKPVPKSGDILLKVKAAAICGSDIRMIANGYAGVSRKTPRIYGHEIAGIIEQVGEDVADAGYAPGDSVAVAPNIGCGVCDMCVSGNTHLCADYRAFGINMDGGFAEYVIIPEKAVRQGNLVKINTGGTMSYAKAAVVEPLSCVYNGFEKLNIRPNDTVLIIGSGPIGIMHAILAKMGGASKVIVNDLNENRLAAVSEFDPFFKTYHGDCLKEYIMAETEGRGVDACITACPAPAAQAMALELLAMNGRVNFFGGLPAGRDRVELSTNLIHYKQLVVTGSARASLRQYRTCMRLVESGIIGIDGILSAEYPLEDYEKAITAARRGEKLKHIFVF